MKLRITRRHDETTKKASVLALPGIIVRCNKTISNEEVSADEFNAWLAMLKPATIVFEACGTSNYWKQVATSLGHDARLISAKLIAKIRQNQKTDKNDALAVVQASPLADIKFINGKPFEQQALQAIMRMRELAVRHKIAVRNLLEALLLDLISRCHLERVDSVVRCNLCLKMLKMDFAYNFVKRWI